MKTPPQRMGLWIPKYSIGIEWGGQIGHGGVCIVAVMCFHKMYGLNGLKHHLPVQKRYDVTIVTHTQLNVKIELEFWEAEFAKIPSLQAY